MIPKSQAAYRVDQFRPIALCNISLKIITKILACRLRKYLGAIVHPSQSAFIPQRAISDNIIINHEVMRYLKTKKGHNGFMAIKIDLAKAYDRVEWCVLLKVLDRLDFSSQFYNLVMECVATARFSVLLNGSPYGFFAAERGLRQGDPLSPALFTIFSDILSRMLAKAELEGRLSGVKVTRTSPRITHLMYADDVVIYGKATVQEATTVKEILQQYCSCTGQELNWNKSSIHFSANVPAPTRSTLSHLLGMKACDHTGTYLGHSFCNFSSKTKEFTTLVEKVRRKLSGWKKQSLSMAGRAVLIRSVLQSMPTFIMQTFFIPKSITSKLDSIMKNFLWRFDVDSQHHLHLISWKQVCQPKSEVGLGIRRTRDVNLALLTKLNWQLNITPHKPWVQLIRAKYLRGRRRLDIDPSPISSSWLWSGLKTCGELFKKGACYQIGVNSNARICGDPWLPSFPSFTIPADTNLPPNFILMRDLMANDGKTWDSSMIRQLFTPSMARYILDTPILDREHGTFVWTPSMSGSFSVRSTYIMIIQARLEQQLPHTTDLYKLLWRSNLHGRHHLLLWRILLQALPTKDKLQRFIPGIDPVCSLCATQPETIRHLLLECPLSKYLWLRSPWSLNIANYSDWSIADWFSFILGRAHAPTLEESEKPKLMQYATV